MNQGHRDFQSLALPTELLRHIRIYLYGIPNQVRDNVVLKFASLTKNHSWLLRHIVNLFCYQLPAEYIFYSICSKTIVKKPYEEACPTRKNVTFLPSSCGFFSNVTGMSEFSSISVINLFARSNARFECCISRPLNITTPLTLLP